MCRVLEVSRSGYYRWCPRRKSARAKENQILDFHINVIYKRHKGRAGSPKITKDLHEMGIMVSKNRVARRMKERGLRSIIRKKYRSTTDSKHSLPVAANLLQRDFSTEAPNIAWVSDITYIDTAQGWLYLAIFLDLYSRRVVGWEFSDSLSSELAVSALSKAIKNRQSGAGLIVHSDQGVQYASNDFREVIDDHHIIQSMSKKGDCWDNSVAESFFNIIKSELIRHENFKNKQEAFSAIFEYIEIYYNRQRRHSTINYKTPVQLEEGVKSTICCL